MPVRPPSRGELEAIASRHGWQLDEVELDLFRSRIVGGLDSYARLDELVVPAREIRYPRERGRRPLPEENTLGGWYWRCEIAGAAEGPLAGRTVAIKDNTCVAGVPMAIGTTVMDGYVPDEDATVVTRILDAGGTIVGKATCESMSHGGGSHTSDLGAVCNPHDASRSAGGSSSGSGALVASGAVDLATGGDQGGSVRLPASWCGIYGLKPTYGLVPYTGIFPIEFTLDHVGPLARTVADVALLLEVLAGPDGLDPRQAGGPAPTPYREALTGDVGGLRLGIVSEGFGWPGYSESDVDDCVREAAHAFERLGCSVTTVSIPWHRDAIHVWNAIANEGIAQAMGAWNGMGTNWKGHYSAGLAEAFARACLARGNSLPDVFKINMLAGDYLQTAYHGHYYAKAQNLLRSLVAAYDDALRGVDLLVMPTMAMKATPLPAAAASREERLARALPMIANTASFNATGHPSLSLPCGVSGGLPIGMMLTGRHGEDATVLRAADAFERFVCAAPPVPA